MRPLFHRSHIWAYPLFAGIGASFGYYLEGLNDRQMDILAERKERLLAKRARRDERERLKGLEGQVDGAVGEDVEIGKGKGPIVASGSLWGR